MITEEYIRIVNDFYKLLLEVEEDSKICDADIVESDKAFGDIRHLCELQYPTKPTQKTKVCQEIRNYSIQRRKAKDKEEIVLPIIEMLKKFPKLKEEMSRIVSIVKKKERDMNSGKTYHPRVLEELFGE